MDVESGEEAELRMIRKFIRHRSARNDNRTLSGDDVEEWRCPGVAGQSSPISRAAIADLADEWKTGAVRDGVRCGGRRQIEETLSAADDHDEIEVPIVRVVNVDVVGRPRNLSGGDRRPLAASSSSYTLVDPPPPDTPGMRSRE